MSRLYFTLRPISELRLKLGAPARRATVSRGRLLENEQEPFWRQQRGESHRATHNGEQQQILGQPLLNYFDELRRRAPAGGK
jgi:hypothetical protein